MTLLIKGIGNVRGELEGLVQRVVSEFPLSLYSRAVRELAINVQHGGFDYSNVSVLSREFSLIEEGYTNVQLFVQPLFGNIST